MFSLKIQHYLGFLSIKTKISCYFWYLFPLQSREEAWQLTMSLKEKADDYLGQFKLCATELEETKAQYELQKK